jgi:phage terminase small subunit
VRKLAFSRHLRKNPLVNQDQQTFEPSPSDLRQMDMRKNATAQRRALFANAYLANGRKGTKAAITAGWNERTAASAASRLLKTAEVKAIIKAADDAVTKIQQVSEASIRTEFARIAFAELGPGVKASDKNAALANLARIEGLFKEAEEVRTFTYADRLQRALDRKRQAQAAGTQEPEVSP